MMIMMKVVNTKTKEIVLIITVLAKVGDGKKWEIKKEGLCYNSKRKLRD